MHLSLNRHSLAVFLSMMQKFKVQQILIWEADNPAVKRPCC